MLRFIAPTLGLLLALPLAANAASKQEYELTQMLEKVARDSSQGTPRAINEDILDQGYTVQGPQLINHLSVRASHAHQMQANPDKVRDQLGASVCSNTGYRQLLARGAILTYDFSEYKTNKPVMKQAFNAQSCGLNGKNTGKKK